MPIRWHVDDPDLLRQAIEYTARQTGFSLRLIEKDYFCSEVLEYLAARDTELTFKGGTCLAKVHSGFYRLSEDLDFSISTPPSASRKERSRRGGRLGPIVRDIPGHLPA
jgi:predicted nucleotidyltransferase component of viral defense system